MNLRLVILVISLALGAASSSGSAEERPAPARTFAILVSVSEYGDASGQVPDLPAARNDTAIIAGALDARGVPPDQIFQHIDQGDRGQGHAQASRAEIAASFRRLSRRVAPGDTVFVHFSGHGLQVPDTDDPAETDGLDEAFVLAGFRPDRDLADQADSLIVDDWLDARFRALLKAGADVVFLADFCHAGDSARNDGSRVVAALAADARPADISIQPGSGQGQFRAVFASPADRKALQSVGPVWASADDQHPGSVLSIYAGAALASADVRSWRDFQSRILAGYGAHRDALPGMSAWLAPPRFEGMDDTPITSSDSDRTTGLFIFDKPAGTSRVGRTLLAYGRLTGLRKGDRLDAHLAADPAGPDGDPLMLLEIREASATTAWAVPIDPVTFEDRGSVELRDAYGGPLNYAARLQLVRRERQAGGNPSDALLRKVVSGLGRASDDVADLPGWRMSRRKADNAVLIARAAREPGFAFAHAFDHGSFDRQISLVSDRLALVGTLHDLALSGPGSADDPMVGIEIGFARTRLERAPTGTDCQPPEGFFANARELRPERSGRVDRISLSGCDAVWVTLSNTGDKAVDISVLVIEPTGQVTPLPLQPELHGARLHPGMRLRAGYQFDVEPAAPISQIAVIAVQAPGDAVEIISFNHLCRSDFAGKTDSCRDAMAGQMAVRSGDSDRHVLTPRHSVVSIVDVMVEEDREDRQGG